MYGLLGLRQTVPQLAIRTEVGVPHDLLDKVAAVRGLAFPELSNAAVKSGLGPLGREYLLAAGGTGYLRLDVAPGPLFPGN